MKTVKTKKSVSALVNAIENDTKREDTKILLKLMEKVTGHKPVIWGDNFIIGFGNYTYTRKGSKKEYEWFNVGFAPRKTNLTVYVSYYLSEDPILKKLGKYKIGKGCLYINRLADVDLDVLQKIIEKSKDTKWFG